MDKTVLLSTFTTLFLAEFGDKTQFAVITLAASSRRPWEVFVGAAAALAAVSALGAFFGEGLLRLVPEVALKRSAAVLFVALGVWMWVRPD